MCDNCGKSGPRGRIVGQDPKVKVARVLAKAKERILARKEKAKAVKAKTRVVNEELQGLSRLQTWTGRTGLQRITLRTKRRHFAPWTKSPTQ